METYNVQVSVNVEDGTISISGLTPEQIGAEDFDKFEFVFGGGNANLRNLTLQERKQKNGPGYTALNVITPGS